MHIDETRSILMCRSALTPAPRPIIVTLMQRYDRQVRSWSSSGQQGSAAARVWAIGRSLAMLECSKDSALAGVGHIVSDMPGDPVPCFSDNPTMSLTKQSRIMNPDLQFESKRESRSADLVVLVRGSTIPSHSKDIPRIVIESDLLNGSIELQIAQPIPILHTHPPGGLVDLRFDLWPEYKEFCDSVDLDSLSEFDFKHVPFAISIVKALQKNADNVSDALKDMQRSYDEDNFKEAFDNLYLVKRPPVPDGVKQVSEFAKLHNCIESAQSDSSLFFWKCVNALDQFVSTHKRLPLSGEIPDMTSDSATYVQLKQTYRDKAKMDVRAISAIATDVPEEYVREFCKNSRYIKVLAPSEGANKKIKLDKDQQQPPKKTQELPPVASLIGGMAAQEATKVSTCHYSPISGRLFFDGATQTTRLDSTSSVIN